MSRIPAKSLAIVAAAVLATSTPLALAPAVAQQTAPAAPTSGIDLNADATLTIEKRLGEVDSTTPAPGGFQFTVEMINLDNPLNTAAGWSEAQSIIEGTKPATVIESETLTIGSDGKATASMPVGLYRVTEVQNGAYTVAAPFFVTLPLIEDGKVNYNPTISPKNQLLEPTKSAADTNVTVGEDIVYTVNAPVPAGDVLQDGTRTINQFRIVDQLQQGLTYNQAEPARISISAGSLDPATDFTVNWETGTNTLTVDFTEEGRAKLAQLRADNPDLSVSVEFNATVNQIPANGQFSNTAQVFIPNATEPLDTTPETEDDGTDGAVTTQYVDVTVNKTVNGVNVDEGNTGAGAVFEIYECTARDSGTGYTVADGATPLTGTNADGNAAAETSAITTAGGDANAAAAANGYALQFDPEKQYCAVETQAPDGYLLNPDPTPLNPTTEGTESTRPVYTATVNNVRDNIFGRLPSTGERGMIALLAIGLVLFAGGAAYQLRRNNA